MTPKNYLKILFFGRLRDFSEKIENEMPLFVKKCGRLGVRYTNIMPSIKDQDSGQGRTWQDTLSASDKISAETKLKNLNYSWKWLIDDSLKKTCRSEKNFIGIEGLPAEASDLGYFLGVQQDLHEVLQISFSLLSLHQKR